MNQHFVLADPRTFEGDPFEVASRACAQAAALAGLLTQAIEAAEIQARNAEMTRNLDAGEDAGAGEWDNSPQGRVFDKLSVASMELEKKIGGMVLAAGYNPKNPPKED